jgi:hypothetical protein
MATLTETRFPVATEALRDVLSEIEEKVVTGYTLADAIREGSTVTAQEFGWGAGDKACALSAAAVAATARGYSV